MNLDDIKLLKKKGMSDAEIAESLGVSISKFQYMFNPKRVLQIKDGQKKYFKTYPLAKKWSNFKARGPRSDQATYRDVLAKFGTNPRCYLTGTAIDLSRGETYEIDHIVPLSKGGTSDLCNAGLSTKMVNRAKAQMCLDEFYQLCELVLAHRSLTGS